MEAISAKPHIENLETLAETIFGILSTIRNTTPRRQSTDVEREADARAHHLGKIKAFIRAGAAIEMVLPAFPAKSSNPEKTTGTLPDLGEVLALERLDGICEDIRSIYAPGARIIICSDGRVFSDLVQVSDENVTAYGREIRRIIDQRGLRNLGTYDLDDLFAGDVDFDETRARLVASHGEPLERLRDRVRQDEDTRSLYNGISRFLFEDFVVLFADLSRNQCRKLAGRMAYEVIQRSNAWSHLVEKQFPTAVRLSIHPQAHHSRKIGIQLVPSENIWRTPWHAATVFDGREHRLVRREEAQAAGYMMTRTPEGYTFFAASRTFEGEETHAQLLHD